MDHEYTPVNLSKLSITQLKEILEQRNRDTRGTKWELLERILNTERNPGSTSKSINSLPGDMLREIALNLDYEDISNLCTSSKKFNEFIWHNNEFWMKKMERDFPGVVFEPQLTKTRYMNLYLNDLRRFSKDLYSHPPKHNKGLSEIASKISQMQIELDRLKALRFGMIDRSKENAKLLYAKAQRLSNATQKTSQRFINIGLGQKRFKEFSRIVPLTKDPIEVVESYLESGTKLQERDLVGISSSKVENPPHILIYIYRGINDNLQISYAFNDFSKNYKIPEMLRMHEGNRDIIKKRYRFDLPD
jgi:hypothetical protein